MVEMHLILGGSKVVVCFYRYHKVKDKCAQICHKGFEYDITNCVLCSNLLIRLKKQVVI